MPGTTDLPPVAQLLGSIIGLAIAVAVWFFGYLKKPSATVSKDVVLPNITVMDGMAFRQAADSLRENMAQNEARERIVRELLECQRTVVASLREDLQIQRELLAVHRDILQATRHNGEILESVDDRLQKEYFDSRREREAVARRLKSGS